MENVPCELIQLILSYNQDSLVYTAYEGGQLVSRINWRSDERYIIEATYMTKKYCSLYWTMREDPYYRIIFRYAKEHFRKLLVRQNLSPS